MGVRNQAHNEISQEIIRATMTGISSLGYVLQLVIDGSDDGAFATEDYVHQREQPTIHVLTQRDDELHATCGISKAYKVTSGLADEAITKIVKSKLDPTSNTQRRPRAKAWRNK